MRIHINTIFFFLFIYDIYHWPLLMLYSLFKFDALESLIYHRRRERLRKLIYLCTSIYTIYNYITMQHYIELLLGCLFFTPIFLLTRIGIIPRNAYQLEYFITYLLIYKCIRLLCYSFYETWKFGTFFYDMSTPIFLVCFTTLYTLCEIIL